MSKKISLSLEPADVLKALLTGFIIFSLAYSFFLDYRQWHGAKKRGQARDFAFEKLLALEEGGRMAAKELTAFYNYFHAFIEAEPSWADSRSLTGFCAYHLGQKDRALELYLKAAGEQEYAGFLYNAGAIYYEKGRYREALEMFRKALSVKVERNTAYIEQARVFKFLIMRIDPLSPPLVERIKRDYALSAYFASLCLQKLNDPTSADLLKKKSLEMGDFGQEKMKKARVYIF